MLSSDKLIIFGINGFVATTLYYAMGQQIATRALQFTLGGIASSTLFQAYYPDFCNQLKEKCGEKLTKSMVYLSPGLICLAGYLGGLPHQINFIALAIITMAQIAGLTFAYPYFDNQCAEEINNLCKQAEGNIWTNQLLDAEILIEQAEQIMKKRIAAKELIGASTSSSFFTLDKMKLQLVNAYLRQSLPDYEKVEKKIHSIYSNNIKVEAFEVLINHLLRIEGEQSKVLRLADECRSLVKQEKTSLLTILLKIAVKYNDSEILKEVEETVVAMTGESYEIDVLFLLIEESMRLKKTEFALTCFQKAEQLLASLEQQDALNKDKIALSEDNYNWFIFKLFIFAYKLEKWEIAKHLLNNERLKGSAKIKAEILAINCFGKPPFQEVEKHIQNATVLIEASINEEKDLKAMVRTVELQQELVKTLLAFIDQNKKFKEPEFEEFYFQKVEQLVASLEKKYESNKYCSNLLMRNTHSEIIYHLFIIALTRNKWQIAECLLNNARLREFEKMPAEIMAARYLRKLDLQAAKKHIQNAIALGEVCINPKEGQKTLKEVIKFQLTYDYNDAYATALKLTEDRNKFLTLIAIVASQHSEGGDISQKIMAELETQYESLTVGERLSLMQLQLQYSPDTLFSFYEKYRKQMWEKEDPDFLCKAFMILAKAHLERKEFGFARSLIAEIERQQNDYADLPTSPFQPVEVEDAVAQLRKKTWDKNWTKIKEGLQTLHRALSKRNSWISWAS